MQQIFRICLIILLLKHTDYFELQISESVQVLLKVVNPYIYILII